MKYGLIAERVGHSFSAEIHKALFGYDYELKAIEKQKHLKFAQSSISSTNVGETSSSRNGVTYDSIASALQDPYSNVATLQQISKILYYSNGEPAVTKKDNILYFGACDTIDRFSHYRDFNLASWWKNYFTCTNKSWYY